MDETPRTSPPLKAWDALARTLDGPLHARALGLLGSSFALLDDGGKEWGRLAMLGSYAAEVHVGGDESEIERTGEFGERYRMRTNGAPLLIAGPEKPKEGLRIFCGGKAYEAETNILRNTSVARRLIGDESDPTADEVRLAGSIAGRSYRASFPAADGSALAVAIFLLYRNVAIRRTAF